MSSRIASKIFSPEDQEKFAALSGDYNPIHLDPIYARRLIYGLPVVHGLHLVAWTLEVLAAEKNSNFGLARLKTRFSRPALVGELITCDLVRNSAHQLDLSLGQFGAQCAFISVHIGPQSAETDSMASTACPPAQVLDRQWDELSAASGVIPIGIDMEACKQAFPFLLASLGLTRIAAFLATTKLVGMECPGLHSILGELDINFRVGSGNATTLAYRVTTHDRRFSLIGIDLETRVMEGRVKAFFRPPPQFQPNFSEIRSLYPANIYSGVRALIVGGTRGLGEVFSKALAAGGAKVTLTYASGEKEALAIAEDINRHGGCAAISQLDVLAPAATIRETLHSVGHPTHILYLATPPIFAPKGPSFDWDSFERFCRYYIQGFVTLIEIAQTMSAEHLDVFWPSSVAIDDVVPNMIEYSAAKAAGEVVCRNLERRMKNVSFHVERLGRIRTDQTGSLQDIAAENALPVVMRTLETLMCAWREETDGT